MPLGATRALTISFALHFAALAWVLPTRPRPAVEVPVPEAPVEMVMAAEESLVAEEAAEAATELQAAPIPPAMPEATAEAARAEATAPAGGAMADHATAGDTPASGASGPESLPAPVTPAPAVARRPVQPRAVTTVVPRPARPGPAAAGGGVGGGVGGGIGGGGSAPAVAPSVPPSDYVAAVQAVLARQRRYPPEARARGAEGTAWLRFTIRRDGGIVAANVARSSGDPTLDVATEEMAARSVLPPLPESWTAPTMTLIVPVSYALR